MHIEAELRTALTLKRPTKLSGTTFTNIIKWLESDAALSWATTLCWNLMISILVLYTGSRDILSESTTSTPDKYLWHGERYALPARRNWG